MRAFHNDEAVKQKYLDRVAAHMAADNLIRGTGWEGGKGCAVGCTLESYEHERYETELGIPEWLAHLVDWLFETMPIDDALTWPKRFLEALPTGFDKWDYVWHRFYIYLLTEDAEPAIKFAGPEAKAVIEEVARLHLDAIENPCGDRSAAWIVARSAAKSGAESTTWSATWSAAESGTWSGAESVAWSAAESATWSGAESATAKRQAEALLRIIGEAA